MSLIVLIVLGFFCAPVTLYAESEHALKEKKLKQLRARIASVQTSLNQVKDQYQAINDELKSTEKQIGRLSRQIRENDQAIERLSKELVTLKQQRREQEKQLAQYQELLAGQVRASYVIGRQEYMKLLLNQQEPATVGRVLSYYDYFNRRRSEQIHDVNKLLKELAETERRINQSQMALSSARERKRQEKNALEQSQLARKQLINRLNRDIADKGAELKVLSRDRQQLENLLQQLREALADITKIPSEKPFAQLRGKMDWPTNGKLHKLFGRWRSAGKVKWQGVLIDTNEGSNVHAISHGRVAYADWLRGYGLLIIVDHGDGYMSLYGHNQSLLKEVGDWVNNDEVIATVGNSGGRQTPGLYFEIRKNGQPSNPTRWCSRMPKRTG